MKFVKLISLIFAFTILSISIFGASSSSSSSPKRCGVYTDEDGREQTLHPLEQAVIDSVWILFRENRLPLKKQAEATLYAEKRLSRPLFAELLYIIMRTAEEREGGKESCHPSSGVDVGTDSNRNELSLKRMNEKILTLVHLWDKRVDEVMSLYLKNGQGQHIEVVRLSRKSSRVFFMKYLKELLVFVTTQYAEALGDIDGEVEEECASLCCFPFGEDFRQQRDEMAMTQQYWIKDNSFNNLSVSMLGALWYCKSLRRLYRSDSLAEDARAFIPQLFLRRVYNIWSIFNPALECKPL